MTYFPTIGSREVLITIVLRHKRKERYTEVNLASVVESLV